LDTLGRVLDALGNPIDGKGGLKDVTRSRVEGLLVLLATSLACVKISHAFRDHGGPFRV